MLIKKDNIVIRNAKVEDSVVLAKWWNDGKVMEHAGFPNGLNTSAEEITAKIASDSDDTRRRLIIEFDNKPIGEMSFTNEGNKTASIGIKICDFSFQEKGIGKKALSMLISNLFYQLDYQKIILDTNLKNLRAQHVYEKLGFKKIRVNENAWKDQLGNIQSTVDYELCIKDFVDYTK